MTDLVALFKKVKPCVVAIAPEPHWPKGQNAPPPLQVDGTGFCVDPLGIIVTAKHVVEPMMSEGYPIAAFASFEKTITHGRFPLFFYYPVDDLDVAVCRVWNPPMPLPALSVRTGESIEEGTRVASCGYPLGLAYAPGGTPWLGVNNMSSIFQAGIVGSVMPSPAHLSKDKDRFRLDMALNPGNSGGPVFLEDGTVIAVVVEGPWPQEDVLDEHGRETRLYCHVPPGLTDALPINSRILEIVEEVKRMPAEELDSFREKALENPRRAEAEFRAKVREMLAQGGLPSGPPAVQQPASGDEPCTLCGGPGPHTFYSWPSGQTMRVHEACDDIWKEERERAG